MSDSDSTAKRHLAYLHDWWSYLRGPGAFFSTLDIESTGQVARALKYLSFGALGAVAFSIVNLRLTGYPGGEDTKKLFEGQVLAHALVLGCLAGILIAHLLSLLVGGRGSLRRTFVAFAFTYAFIWPTTALVLILLGGFLRLTLGIPWVELPPFAISQPIHIERTPRNILVVALAVTVLLWVLGFLLYGYVRAVMTAHRVGPFRGLAVAVGTVLALEVVPIAGVAHKTAQVLDPVIGWLLKIV